MVDADAQRFVSAALAREDAQRLAAVAGEAGWPLVVAASAFELPDDAAAAWQVEVFCDAAQAAVLEASIEEHLQELAALAGIAEAGFRPEALPDVDWVARVQQGLRPVRAGRFFVHGAHDRQQRALHAINIEIEAGQAFGTGHHGTTQGCLLALEWLLKRRHLGPSGMCPIRVLDVGTGSGVLGIAAARALKVRVVATDIDPVAVATARENARLNGVPGMRLVVAAGTRHALVQRFGGGERPLHRAVIPRPGVQRVRRALAASRVPQALYSRWRVLRPPPGMPVRQNGHDLVFANILARPLMRMAAELRAQMRPGGWLVLSGLLRQQEAMVLAAFLPRGLRLERRWRLGEWSTLLLRLPGVA